MLSETRELWISFPGDWSSNGVRDCQLNMRCVDGALGRLILDAISEGSLLRQPRKTQRLSNGRGFTEAI